MKYYVIVGDTTTGHYPTPLNITAKIAVIGDKEEVYKEYKRLCMEANETDLIALFSLEKRVSTALHVYAPVKSLNVGRIDLTMNKLGAKTLIDDIENSVGG